MPTLIRFCGTYLLDPQAHLEHLDHRELQGDKDHRELQEDKDHREPQGGKAHQEEGGAYPDSPMPWIQLGIRGALGKSGLAVTLTNKVRHLHHLLHRHKKRFA